MSVAGPAERRDVRSVKLDAGLHRRLKTEAARRGVSMLDLLAELVDAGTPPDARPARPRRRERASA